jgi:hypothetical protein
MQDMKANSLENTEEYATIKNIFFTNLDISANKLNLCMYVCFIHLLFPVNILMEWFFLAKTNRKPSDISVTFVNELCLFTVVINWINDWQRFKGLYDPEIEFADPKMSPNQMYICNLISSSVNGTYPFDAFMALIAMNTWFKLLLKLRVTKQFGPLFKVLQQMIIGLLQFMVLWTIELIIFTSISMLMFGQIDRFTNFFTVLVFYFEAALGSWDTKPYCLPTSY